MCESGPQKLAVGSSNNSALEGDGNAAEMEGNASGSNSE